MSSIYMSSMIAIASSVLMIDLSAYAADDKAAANAPADHSAQNMQAENKKLDAQSQGHSKADVELTRKIRQAVVKDDSLSTNAHNIKIITMDGNVILKGPVKSIEERKKIESLARKVAGKAPVKSDLEIEIEKK